MSFVGPMWTRAVRRDFSVWLKEVIPHYPSYAMVVELMIGQGFIASHEVLNPMLLPYELLPSHEALRVDFVRRILQSHSRSQCMLWIAHKACASRDPDRLNLVSFWCSQLLQLPEPIVPFWPRLGRGFLITVDAPEVPAWLNGLKDTSIFSFRDFVRACAGPIGKWEYETYEWEPTKHECRQLQPNFEKLIRTELKLLADGEVLVVAGGFPVMHPKVGAWLHVGGHGSITPWDQQSWASFCTSPLAVIQSETEFQSFFSWMQVSYARTPHVPRLPQEYRQDSFGRWMVKLLQHFGSDHQMTMECIRPLGFRLDVSSVMVFEEPWWIFRLNDDWLRPKPIEIPYSVWACPAKDLTQLKCLWCCDVFSPTHEVRMVSAIHCLDPLVHVVESLALSENATIERRGSWVYSCHSPTQWFLPMPLLRYASETLQPRWTGMFMFGEFHGALMHTDKPMYSGIRVSLSQVPTPCLE